MWYKNILTNLKTNYDISTFDMPPGVPEVSKNPENQTEDHSDNLEW